MAALFASGHAADIVLGVMAVEALLLIMLDRQRPAAVALLLLPGALFMLGLRAALVGAPWQWTALPVALAFPFHLIDVATRRRTSERRRS